MIRVLIAEDQGLILGALAALLNLERDIEVIANAADGAEALELARAEAPDVIVTDIEMPRMTGLDLAEAAQRENLNVRILIVTTFARPGYLRRALEAGVAGYVLKDSSSDELAAAVRKVAAGQRAISAELAEAVWCEPDPLTHRERQILRSVERGASNKAIAAELGLSPGTVRNYLAEAAAKLSAANRIEAARIARGNGWL